MNTDHDETLKAKEELRRRVDDIIAISNDDELAHSNEDDLHVELLHEYLPNELWIEIARLNNADFARWCA